MNFVLRHKGNGVADAEQFKSHLAFHNIQVTDDSALPKMAKVSIDDTNLPTLKKLTQEDWDLFPEKQYQIPTTKQSIKRS